jgi:WD40 repeat protein
MSTGSSNRARMSWRAKPSSCASCRTTEDFPIPGGPHMKVGSWATISVFRADEIALAFKTPRIRCDLNGSSCKLSDRDNSRLIHDKTRHVHGKILRVDARLRVYEGQKAPPGKERFPQMSAIARMVCFVMFLPTEVFAVCKRSKTAEPQRAEDRPPRVGAKSQLAAKTKMAPEKSERSAEKQRAGVKGQARQAGRFLRYVLALAAVLVLGWPQCPAATPPPPRNVWWVAWSPDGKRLVTAEEPVAAKVWDAETGKELLTLGLRNGISSITWSPDGTRLATASQDDPVTVWDAETGKEVLTLGVHSNGGYVCCVGSASGVAWSPDGKRLATGTTGPPPSKAMIEAFRAHGLSVNLEKSPFDVVKVWDAKTGKELLALNGRDKPIWSVAWSPDGKRLAGISNGTAKVWDAETGKELLTFGGDIHPRLSVAWSPDGKRLAACSTDGTAKVWDTETGEEMLTLGLQSNGAYGVSSVAWSPDGIRLATGSREGKAKLWDAATGQELLTLSSHSGPVLSVAWSPDGTRLATGGDCLTAKVWDTETGKELLKLEGVPGCEEPLRTRPQPGP